MAEGPQAEQQRLLREALRRFVRKELWLWEKRMDPNAWALPAEVSAALGETVSAMGLSLLREPESLGGAALDAPTRGQLCEELAQHRAGVLAPGYGLFGPETPTPLYAASAWQREQFLLPLLQGEARCFLGLHDPPPPPAPASGVRIRARRTADGWMLDGTKLFVAGAGAAGADDAADFGVVFARTEEADGTRLGVSCFLVETDRPGFQRWRAYPTIAAGRDTQEVNLSNVRIPAEHLLGAVGQGPSLAPEARRRRDLNTAAQLVGVAAAAQDIARQMGARAAADDSARWALAEQETALRSARLMTRQAAAASAGAEPGRDRERAAAAARRLAVEAASRVVDGTITLLGPAGLSADLPLERWYRELRVQRAAAGEAQAGARAAGP